MARARNIKPGFFDNEDLADCGPYAMLLFVGMWTLADREGRMEDRPRRIKAKLFSYFDVDIDRELNALHEAGFIERYTVAGEAYIQIPNFTKHQTPHVKEAASTIPEPDKPGASPVQSAEKPHETVALDEHGTSTVLAPPDTGYLNPDSLIPDTGLQERDAPAAPVPLPKYSQVFEVFWREYPTGHGSKVKTYAAWKAHGLDKAGAEDERYAVMAGLRAWKVCERWSVKHMIKAAETWVKERWWDNPPPPADMARASPNGKMPSIMDELKALDPSLQPSIETTWRPR